MPKKSELSAHLAGHGAEVRRERKLEKLEAELAERDQVIGELTVANRILKKLSGGLS